MINYGSLYSMGLTPGENLGVVQKFRRVDRDGFNIMDVPDQRFFKLLFYFYNEDGPDSTQVDWFDGGSSGLLTPTWLENPTGDYYKYNSAWSYLKSNYEDERADALKEFVTLLSQISSESPWYFKEITGVEEALVREKWVVNEERKKISIKCMNDPVDHRIESLLSLYRSIVWSHARKCEVLPANLRKFDMGLFVFSGLVNGVNYTKTIDKKGIDDIKWEDFIKRGGTPETFNWSNIGDDRSPYTEETTTGGTKIYKPTNAAYKYIEFHNCEISMDSLKSGFGTLSNETGNEQEFTIDIYFDDCYENEYNPYMLKFFGDFFVWDLWSNKSRDNSGNVMGSLPVFKNTSNQGSGNELVDDIMGRFENIKTQAMNTVNGSLDDIKNSALSMVSGGLGNIYGKGGGIAGALDATEQELSKQIKSLQNKAIGNITSTANKISKSVTSAVVSPALGTIKNTGNLVADVVDTATNIVTKPVLGTLNAVDTAVTRAAEVGTSYIDEAGNYVSNESKHLGDIAYDSQYRVANQIGKNRLNAKLGKL